MDFLKKVNPIFSKELPADSRKDNSSRQVEKACFSFVKPLRPEKPELIHHSKSFANELGIDIGDKNRFTKLMSGVEDFGNFEPYAMCYGGHQFGSWAGQLGDGRAINIAEMEINDVNWKFQLKGAGPTPYSRNSDGLAVLRSSIREYLCSEAMHNLGIASTRALSLSKSGNLVTRDILYNGNPKEEHGAIVCRVAQSFIRFGSFEIFAARGDYENLKKLVDYTILNHFSYLGSERNKKTYLNFFNEVVKKTNEMIVDWQRVGFVHGVMNTDNMSILGLTIDYGPYGWLEDYSPLWTPNTTDAQHKRYRFGNQPSIALWNLTQLANAIYSLIDEVKPLENILNQFKIDFKKNYHKMMCDKLGIQFESNVTSSFIDELENMLTEWEMDMTIFFRELSQEFRDFDSFWISLKFASYAEPVYLEKGKGIWEEWFTSYNSFLLKEKRDIDERIFFMKKVNPKYVLRNYMAQLAIEDAEKGKYDLIDELYNLLLNPYDEQLEMEKWYVKRPDWAKEKIGCSMLSCSS